MVIVINQWKTALREKYANVELPLKLFAYIWLRRKRPEIHVLNLLG